MSVAITSRLNFCPSCGARLSKNTDGETYCPKCDWEPHETPSRPAVQRHRPPPLPGPLSLGFVGALVGGFSAFLLRPGGGMFPQLPLEVILAPRENLRGLDELLVPMAERSFNMLAVGVVLGAFAGLVLGYLIRSIAWRNTPG